MTDSTYQKGLNGESRAIRYLQNRGMVLLQTRYRSPFGEIDAVMMDGDTLVFVEVKARNTGASGSGLSAVGKRKQAKLIKTALQYLAEYGCEYAARFDVIELPADGVQHIENAFEA
jgi:putative endonuclease